jgi:type VI secretion system protein VasJ
MSYSSELSSYYLELAKASVSKEAFAGEDVRFSSEYEALEGELGKAQSIHESGQTDWRKVCENSETLLRTQSKDLRVGAWLTWGLYRCESFPGLLAGLGFLRYLCENHWSEIHPGKSRTRTAALTWLVTRLEQVFGENIAIKEQLPLFRRLVEHLEGLDAACTGHLGDDAPLLLPISRRLKNRVQRAADSPSETGLVGLRLRRLNRLLRSCSRLAHPSTMRERLKKPCVLSWKAPVPCVPGGSSKKPPMSAPCASIARCCGCPSTRFPSATPSRLP